MAVHAGGAFAGQQDLVILTHLVALDLHYAHLDDACQLLGQNPAGPDSTSDRKCLLIYTPPTPGDQVEIEHLPSKKPNLRLLQTHEHPLFKQPVSFHNQNLEDTTSPHATSSLPSNSRHNADSTPVFQTWPPLADPLPSSTHVEGIACCLVLSLT